MNEPVGESNVHGPKSGFQKLNLLFMHTSICICIYIIQRLIFNENLSLRTGGFIFMISFCPMVLRNQKMTLTNSKN